MIHLKKREGLWERIWMQLRHERGHIIILSSSYFSSYPIFFLFLLLIISAFSPHPFLFLYKSSSPNLLLIRHPLQFHPLIILSWSFTLAPYSLSSSLFALSSSSRLYHSIIISLLIIFSTLHGTLFLRICKKSSQRTDYIQGVS